MKNSNLIKVFIALLMVLLLSQASASGMKYDPIENYYNTYYGMDSLVNVNTSDVVIKTETKINTPISDPYDAYYDVFYKMAEEKVIQAPKVKSKVKPDVINSMSDPLNFYDW